MFMSNVPNRGSFDTRSAWPGAQVAAGGTAPAGGPQRPDESLTLAILRTGGEFGKIAAEWTDLHRRTKCRNPFLSFAWTEACWLHRKRRAQLFLCTARRAGELVAIAPLCIETWHGLKTLRFLADERSDYLGFLCLSPELEQRLLGLVLAQPEPWDLALLGRLAPGYSALCASALPAGWTWARTQSTSAPFCAWEGDWESLHKDGPSWFREMRKRRRRFFKDGGTAARLTGAEAIAQLESVAAIERQSWKGEQTSMRLQQGAGQEILRKAFASLGQRGEMQLWLAELEGRPIAFQIDFVLPGRLLHYQCAFDARFSGMRAGSVLAYLSLENGWKRGIREFDYLSGEEPYKLQRTNTARPIYQLAAYRPSLRGRTAYWLVAGARARLREVKALRTLRAGWIRLRARAARSCRGAD